ncbi:putative membrane protein [Gillisia sp. Hel_I_86]|uniref:DUF2231 domain-containing protein n=1 Tax=Gillisia sp. Hel_I_86 TaxID=1249981 RepID=UPI00119BD49A|nr:DUF2231 domain-containing protein [Gillisia sp. Hel_I_86]TVZ26854.1 putative membrane protein [Gillisia sp. Hel_I_86]
MLKQIGLLLVFLCFVNPINAQDGHEHGDNEMSHTELSEVQDPPEESQMDGDLINREEVAIGDFPSLHPLVVHFPIVLLLLAAVFQLFQLFIRKRNLDWVVLFCIGFGFIGAYVAGTFVHPDTKGLSDIAQKILDNHDTVANWTIWTSAIAAVLKTLSLFVIKQNKIFEILILVVMGIAVFSVSKAGHYGSQLVHIQNVGPQGKYLGEDGAHSH